MVKLPSYDNDTSISVTNIGAVAPLDSTARAVSNLAGALGNVGLQLRADQEKASAKQQQLADRSEAIAVESDLLDLQLKLDQRLKDAELNRSADGTGIFDTFSKSLNEDTDKVLKKYRGSGNSAEIELRAKRLTSGFLDRAADVQWKSTVTAMDDVTKRKAETLTAAVKTDPDALDTALTEASELVDRFKLPEKATARIKLGLAHQIERARLEGMIERDPEAVIKTIGKAFAGDASASASPVGKTIIAAAQRYGVDPLTFLSLAHLESRLDANTVPRLKDGSLASSAKGVFQMIDGVAKEWGVDPRNTEQAADAVAKYVKKQTGRLEGWGQKVSPGKVYLSWFLGEGAFGAVMTSDPSTPIDDALRKVWSPALIAKAKDGNPYFFGNGRSGTVGELIARAEEGMAWNAKKVAGQLNGADAIISDDGKALATQLLGREPSAITMADVREAYESAQKLLKTRNAGKPDLEAGRAYIDGRSTFDFSDNEAKKSVDGVIYESGLAERFTKGDQAALDIAYDISNRLSYVPKPVVNSVRAMMLKGDEGQKTRAYEFVARLSQSNALAADVSRIPTDIKSRADKYEALVGPMGMSPVDAIQRVETMEKPEFKKSLEGLKESGTLKTWRARRTWSDLTGESDVSWLGDPEAINKGQREAILAIYRDHFDNAAAEFGDEKEASAAAKVQMSRTFGNSTLFGRQRYMQFPPEKVVPAVEGSHDWIQAQAQEDIQSATGKTIAYRNIFLLPRTETRDDIAAGSKSPRYELIYRDENGMLQKAPHWFRPSAQKAHEMLKQKARSTLDEAKAVREMRESTDPASIVAVP